MSMVYFTYNSDGLNNPTTTLNFAWISLLIASVLMVVVYWKLFIKAGEPGWASLIPFYCNYVLFKIAFGNAWYFLFFFMPIFNIIVAILLPFRLAKTFGKSTMFGVGLLLLPIVFYPILAFGNSEFKNPYT